jgi:hypothetical protein
MANEWLFEMLQKLAVLSREEQLMTLAALLAAE